MKLYLDFGVDPTYIYTDEELQIVHDIRLKNGLKKYISDSNVKQCRQAIIDRAINGYYLTLDWLLTDFYSWIDYHQKLCRDTYKLELPDQYWEELKRKCLEAIRNSPHRYAFGK